MSLRTGATAATLLTATLVTACTENPPGRTAGTEPSGSSPAADPSGSAASVTRFWRVR
jgi:hypothetical protein